MKNANFATVVLGDLHGSRGVLERALLDLGFVDSSGRWSGGRRRLIQLGDVIDRGPEGLACMELLMRLQAEALAAGGEVVCLLGNHEAMAVQAWTGDHTARLMWAFNGGDAGFREWAAQQGRPKAEVRLPYPEEFYAMFGPEGRYGRWLRTHALACLAGGWVVVHAGWAPGDPTGVAEANRVWAEAPAEPRALAAWFEGPGQALGRNQGLLWARYQPEAEVADACERLGCRGMIAGHTPVPDIRASFGARLIQIDTGMHSTGVWSALGLDDQGTPWALSQDRAPRSITGDGGMEARPAGAPAGTAPEPRFQPGRLLCLYHAADRREYFLVRQVEGGSYEGLSISRTNRGWSCRPGRWPAPVVDRIGVVAEPGEVPEELIDISA